MAVDDEDLELDESKGAKKKSSGGMKKIILIVMLSLVVVTISIVGTLFATGAFSGKSPEAGTEKEVAAKKKADEKADSKADPKVIKEVFYESLTPPFVVNFEDKNYVRFLQVSVDVMAESQVAIDNIKKHMPVIRNNIVFILGEVTYTDISTREGKEGLRKRILKDVQGVLKERAGDESVKELFFTSFVMQ